MFLLLLVIEAERLVGAGKRAVGNRNRQNCQGALDSYLDSGLRSPGWGRRGGKNPSLSQRQSLAQPTTTLGLELCSTNMNAVKAGVQDS